MRKAIFELNILSDLVADYEEANYAVPKPTLVEVLKIRMVEMELNQKLLSNFWGEYVESERIFDRKSEPTLQVTWW
jgi:HTH-type transcriptional regulator/antitoxin HigA